eukprot:m.1651017 g.1651017  ORF g.1651017 m.1651017 type:complete len:68 (-) comp89187_c0_seq1:176-379(-)
MPHISSEMYYSVQSCTENIVHQMLTQLGIPPASVGVLWQTCYPEAKNKDRQQKKNKRTHEKSCRVII